MKKHSGLGVVLVLSMLIPFTPIFAVINFQGNWTSLNQRTSPDWYRDAKLGIFLHWGVPAVPAQAGHYSQLMYMEGSTTYDYHVAHYGHPSVFGYKDIIPLWKAEKWNPDSLAGYFKSIGFKYIVPVAVHHDNFDCWNSKYQQWNSVALGPKRDILGEWAAAARKQGLRIGASFHHDRTWWYMPYCFLSDTVGALKGVPYDGNMTAANGVGKWWNGLDPAELYCTPHALSVTTPPLAYQQKWYNRMVDALDKYHLDLMWWDFAMPFDSLSYKAIAYFYNQNQVWNNGNFEAVMCNKQYDQPAAVTIDYEIGGSSTIRAYPWQSVQDISQWYYAAGASAKSIDLIVDDFVDIVSKNGNVLLDAALKADGTFDTPDMTVLDQLRAWMNVNSEGIYSTRPFPVYGEGTTVIGDGPSSQNMALFKATDIRYTRNKAGTVLYIFLGDWPGNGVVANIPTLSSAHLNKSNLTGITMLGGGACTWTQDAAGLKITMPAAKPATANYEFCFKASFSGVITYDNAAIQVFPPTKVSQPEIGMTTTSQNQVASVTGSLFGKNGIAIIYDCGNASRGQLKLFSPAGKMLISQAVAGTGSMRYKGKVFGNGVYFLQLTAGNSLTVKKMEIVR